MALLVRSWNLFHGRTSPPSRRLYLEEMVRLVSADRPAVVALQEVTPWAFRHLEEWSGMRAVAAVAKRALLGPLARPLHELDPVHVRSLLTGQANALLLDRRLRLVEAARFVVLNPGARRERRICQLARLEEDARRLIVANLHATAHRTDLAKGEVARVGELVADEDRAIVCGDFNVPGGGIDGFSEPIRGVDQILVRGLRLERGPERWGDERRRLAGRLLSDHAPVEAVVS